MFTSQHHIIQHIPVIPERTHYAFSSPEGYIIVLLFTKFQNDRYVRQNVKILYDISGTYSLQHLEHMRAFLFQYLEYTNYGRSGYPERYGSFQPLVVRAFTETSDAGISIRLISSRHDRYSINVSFPIGMSFLMIL